MTFELFTDAPPSPFPAADDLRVRFLWRNGTAGGAGAPTPYPLFGQQNLALAWTDFVSGMDKFAIGSQADWCTACGNSTGACAPSSSTLTSPSSGGKDGGGGGGGGVSRPVAGVIGAMVTLVVVLGVEGLIMLVAGLRLVGKRRLGAGAREGAVRPKA